MKVSLSQKILLLCAALAYAGFLIFFLRANDWGVLACGVLPGVLLLLTLYIGVPSEKETGEAGAYADGDSQQPRVHVDSLIDQVAELRERAEHAEQELSAAMDRISELEEEAAGLSAERPKLEPVEPKTAVFGGTSILPMEEGDKPERIRLADAVEAAAAQLRPLTQRAGIQVRLVSAQEAVCIYASPRLTEILFKNIIDNSIKYMNHEGILQITISEADGEVFVVCKDNGSGLTPQETGHIFELNFQGSNRVSGNGLGLAQVRAIVEYYGGVIYARSGEGCGMGIYIHLPLGLRGEES